MAALPTLLLLLAAGAAPPAAAAQEAAAEEPVLEEGADEDPDRVTFEVRFPEERGGGTARGSAGAIEILDEETVWAGGGVEVRYLDLEIQAREATFHRRDKRVYAVGRVILDQGPRRLSGETMEFELESQTGVLTEATAFVEPDHYFSGKEIAKVGEDRYTVRDGVFTACRQEVPDWSFAVRSARVQVEGYAHVRGARMRVKRVPVLYSPYILWPVKQERASGLLVPNVGYSRRRGGVLGLAHYQTLGPSADATFFADLFTEGYTGLGNELRYRPSEGTEGRARAYFVRDPEEDAWRWRARLEHETDDLPWGLRGVVDFQDFSDFDFFRDFERRLDEASLRTLLSTGFVSGSWGAHSVNLRAENRRTFVAADRVIKHRRLPELEHRMRQTRLGDLPLFLQVESRFSYLELERSPTFQGRYGRADVSPQLTLPLRGWPWLSLSFSGGGRLTWYGDSVEETGQALGGGSLTRTVPTAGAELVGPSFSRVFDRPLGGFARFKHVIEPRWTYTFLGEVDEQDRVPLFDEIDTLRATNVGRLALVNRLLARPAEEEASAREILTFELARSVSFDRDEPLQRSLDGARTRAAGPLEAVLRFSPQLGTSLDGRVTYSTLFDQLEGISLTARGRWGAGNDMGVTWFRRYLAEEGRTTSDQVRLQAAVALRPDRLRLDAEVSYDFERDRIPQQRLVLHYNAQCFRLRLEARELRTDLRRERDFRFSIDLLHVGTFLDLTGGEVERF